MDIKDVVAKILAQPGWDQKRLAKETGRKQSSVSRWAKGSSPRGVAMLRISKISGVKPEEITGVWDDIQLEDGADVTAPLPSLLDDRPAQNGGSFAMAWT